jgi:hypothetical protein
LRSRWGLRAILLMVIGATIPFYCAGVVLLVSVPRPRTATPTADPSTPQVTAGTLTSTTKPTITPISVGQAASPTPIILLNSTPTTISIFATPTPLVMFGSPVGTLRPAFPTPQNQMPYCADFNGLTSQEIRASVPSNAAGGAAVYCRTLTNPFSVGNQSVIDRGIRIAVDVFAMDGSRQVTRFNQAVKLCLQGQGAFVFLDANQSPRTPADLPATYESGYTCASIPNAGTAVLVSR